MGNTIAFEPSRSRQRPSALQTHRLRTAAGDDVPAYFQRVDDPSRPVLLFCHGNADDLDDVVEVIGGELARRLNTSLYVFEYPGYSGTKGPDYEPNEAATYAAAEAAYDDITGRLGYERSRILLYGKSLGSAVATHLALKRPGSGALVLVSAIESVLRVILNAALPGDIMRTIDAIGRQSSPVQLVHGRRDQLARPYNAENLQRLAAGRGRGTRTYAICWLDEAGHNFETTASNRFTPAFDRMVACLERGVMKEFL